MPGLPPVFWFSTLQGSPLEEALDSSFEDFFFFFQRQMLGMVIKIPPPPFLRFFIEKSQYCFKYDFIKYFIGS